MLMDSEAIAHKTIRLTFYTLFFAVPLIFLPGHVELFQFNKMITVYLGTIIITASWLIRMVIKKRILFRKTPLDIPILLFLISQVASTVLSIEPHTSLFGYYSRFHGGLFSTISYILLYYAFVSNMSSFLSYKREGGEQISAGWIGKASNLAGETGKESATKSNRMQPKKFRSPTSPLKLSLFFLIISTTIVSLYGILEHFGIDENYWVQDVRNRVFSTLGQPNWLAALLVMVTPLTLTPLLSEKQLLDRNARGANFARRLGQAIGLVNPPSKASAGNATVSDQKIVAPRAFSILMPYTLFGIFFLTLLYTKSRSGLLGFTLMYGAFWLLAWRTVRQQKQAAKSFLVTTSLILLLTAVVGTPFTPSAMSIINRIGPTTETAQSEAALSKAPLAELGGTESGEIRKIVWHGAIEVWRHSPLFGSGVETFAYSYYNFRPIEHNFVSEWDFLYNKAHNEYLNFLATTGAFGLGTYLFFIASYIFWSIRQIGIKNHESRIMNSSETKSDSPPNSLFILHNSLLPAFLSGFLGVLITNFFGFSTVTDGLLFFMFPAFAIALSPKEPTSINNEEEVNEKQPSLYQWLLSIIVIAIAIVLLFQVMTRWYADRLFTEGKALSDADKISQGLLLMQRAVRLVPGEPLFRDRLSLDLARSASALAQSQEATSSAQFAQLAKIHSDLVFLQNPVHLNFLKNRAATMLHLSAVDPLYRQEAEKALKRAIELAPTDPKLPYNLGLFYAADEPNKAIEGFKQSVGLKPDYEPAGLALAAAFEKKGQLEDAKLEYQAILEFFPSNQTALNALERLATVSGKRNEIRK